MTLSMSFSFGRPGKAILVPGTISRGFLRYFFSLVPGEARVLVRVGIVEARDRARLAADGAVQLRTHEILRVLADLMTGLANLENLFPLSGVAVGEGRASRSDKRDGRQYRHPNALHSLLLAVVSLIGRLRGG